MKNEWAKLFCPLFYAIFLNMLIAGVQISPNPGSLTFQKVAHSYYYDAVVAVQVSVESDIALWSLNMLAAPLSSSSGQIPINQMFVKHDLSGGDDVGAGSGYQMLNTAIHIGSGGITNGFEIINTLYFRITVPNTVSPDTYYGEVQIQTDDGVYSVVIALTLVIDPYLDLALNQTNLVFDVIGPPAVYDASAPLDLTYDSNSSDWKINCEFINMQGSNGSLPASVFYVNSSNFNFGNDEGAGIGFMKLNYPREIMNATLGGLSGMTSLQYRVKTDWNHPPGQYTGAFKISSPQSGHSFNLDVSVDVSEYLYIELDENNIDIQSQGPPGLYDGDKQIKLRVASNAENWQINAHGSDLSSSDAIIPKKRVFLKSSKMPNIGDEGGGVGYMSLDNDRVMATGAAISLQDYTNIQLRVKTTELDKAGSYGGTINFIIVSLP